MRKHSKLLLTAFVAALFMSAAVTAASANRLSFSNRSFRIVWTPVIYEGGGWEVRCNITLEGSFHSSTIAKVVGALIGYVTRANATRPCTGGAWYFLNGTEVLAGVTTANTLPWHIRYRSFTGTLPRITGVTVEVIDYSFLVEREGISNCLFKSTAAAPERWILQTEAAGGITAVRTDETARIPRLSGGIFCPTEIAFFGTGRISLLGTTSTLIFVRLI